MKWFKERLRQVGKGGLPPLNPPYSQREWKDIERGQATLPYCVYASLSYFDEA